MSNGIYAGWGLRSDLAQSLKRLWNAGAKRRDKLELLQQREIVARAKQQLNLASEDGLLALAVAIATGFLDRLNDDMSFGQENVRSASIFPHAVHTVADFLDYEAPFFVPSETAIATQPSTSALWEAEEQIGLVSRRLSNVPHYCMNLELVFASVFGPIVEQHPSLLAPDQRASSDIAFSASLLESLDRLPDIIERVLQVVYAPDLEELQQTDRTRARLDYNLTLASGGVPGQPLQTKSIKLPSKAGAMSPGKLAQLYLDGTPFEGIFHLDVPIELPRKTRFEHHHIVAGSGHGKTQALQQLIAHDLPLVAAGRASVVVIDSQGDLIERISHMAMFAEGGALADRIVLIDPTDVEFPVALNLFDIGTARIDQYSQLDRERLINGVLELYDFVLGSLLDAQMTQKQSVIFRYITRLMLHIPNATIETFRDLLEDGGADRHREHIERLQGSARAFFKTEFDSREFVQTKKQVLRRLWGILENQSFERMFLHPRNKLDLFSELNSGKIILINTAKDLLKEEGTEIFGRFFIAMIAQAAQERSVIPESERMPTFVYVDEAQDYFDRNIGIILSQARKFRVGMVLAHQFLGQLDGKLQESVFANTSIKFAGGVSSKDARALAPELRTSAEFIEQQQTFEFAAYIRGTTRTAASIQIEPGILERQPRMSEPDFDTLRDRMRAQYAVHYSTLNQNADQQEGSAESDSQQANPSHSSSTPRSERGGPDSKGPSLSDDALPWD